MASQAQNEDSLLVSSDRDNAFLSRHGKRYVYFVEAVSRYPAAGKCFQNTRYPAVRNSLRIFTKYLVLLRIVDICLEISSDFKYYLGLS